MENVKKELSSTQKTAINEIAKRINEATTSWDDATIKALFEEFLSLKKGLEKDLQPYCNKVFFSNFNNLTTAKIKVVTRIKTDKVTATSEGAKSVANTLFKDFATQRKGLKSMLKNAISRGKYELHFSQSAYQKAFDAATDSDLQTLFKGANLIKAADLVAYLTKVLKEEERNNKGAK